MAARYRRLPALAGAPGGVTPVRGGAGQSYEEQLTQELPWWPWRGVRWTLVFIGLLVYLFVITSYRLPVAQEVMVVALVAMVVQRDRVSVPRPLIWMGAFVAWCAIGLAFTRYPVIVWDNLQKLVKIWLIALVAANALRTRGQFRLFFTFFLLCYALYPTRGALLNYYVYGESIFGRAYWLKDSVFGNPNDLAAISLLPLSVAVGLVVTEPKRSLVRWGALATIAVLPFLILATQSRAGFLALAATLTVIFVTQRRPLIRLYRASKGRTKLLFSLALVVIIVKAAPAGVWQRVAGLKHATNTESLSEVDKEGSAEQRWEIWRVARQIIARNPLMGVGLGAYDITHQHVVFTDLQSTGEFNETARGVRDVHSTYLNLLAETGVPGLLLFGTAVLSAVGVAERARRRARHQLPRASLQLLCLEFGVLGYFLAGIFGSFAYHPFLHVHLMAMWASACLLQKEGSAPTRPAGAGPASPPPFAPTPASPEGRRPAPHGLPA